MQHGNAVAIAIVAVAIAAAVAIGTAREGTDQGARCGRGFVAGATRCIAPSLGRADGCPPPLVGTDHGCDAPEVRVRIPGGSTALGASDWEAPGRLTPVRAEPFVIDVFEVTRGRWGLLGDTARAASGITRSEASKFCAAHGGHLPTESEWILAAASAANPPHRYPWGDTGAVCRRAAWGLDRGPCARGADGPDTVGSHPDGDTPFGLHDLAGNVAEWVADGADEAEGDGAEPTRLGIAKGGSWQSALATELRLWARLELDPNSHDSRVGFRCAYAVSSADAADAADAAHAP